MSMAVEPDLLLLDEPTAGRPIEETRDTGDFITSLKEERDVSMIIDGHDSEFVQKYSVV